MFASFLFIYNNICPVPHLQMSPKSFTMATIALFSAAEQTHCALVIFISEWMTAAFKQAVLNIHQSDYSAV